MISGGSIYFTEVSGFQSFKVSKWDFDRFFCLETLKPCHVET